MFMLLLCGAVTSVQEGEITLGGEGALTARLPSSYTLLSSVVCCMLVIR
jgi:hypothetical protein